MKLVVILLCLALERYVNFGHILKRWQWLDSYSQLLQKCFKKSTMWQGFLGMAIIVVPIWIVSAIFYFWLEGAFFHIVAFFLQIAILYYCMGPCNLFHEFDEFHIAVNNNDKESADDAASAILQADVPSDNNELHRSMTEALFLRFHECIFSVVFWFAILGPMGAILYRSIEQLRRIELFKANESFANATTMVVQILDWIPIRIVSIAYALIGNFAASFGYWVKHVITSFKRNAEIVVDSGLVALGLKSEDAAANGEVTLNENLSALALLDRTLLIYVVVMALIFTAIWLSRVI